MKMTVWTALALIALSLGCASAPPKAGETTAVATAAPPISRTLEVAVQQEPQVLSPLLLRGGFTTSLTIRPFNAYLELIDQNGTARPYLADALPRLNSDSWVVNPDGTMQTTYHLRPGLTWQDGAPLTADDFVFAWGLYTTPELGVGAASSPPLNQFSGVSAPDDRTLVINWSRLYPGAAVLQTGQTTPGLPPLPRHILGATFQSGEWDALLNHPYWSHEFVGLGPYRLASWQPGSSIEGSGFKGHALGAPKIDRLRVFFYPDSNAALAALRSGAVEM